MDQIDAMKLAEGVLAGIFDAVHEGRITLDSNARLLGVRQAHEQLLMAIEQDDQEIG